MKVGGRSQPTGSMGMECCTASPGVIATGIAICLRQLGVLRPTNSRDSRMS